MYKTRMPHTNVLKKVQWERIELCVIFGITRLFSRASVSFKGGWVVYHDEGRTSWGMDCFIPDAVERCTYGFFRLDPRGHGAVNATR